MKLKLDTQIVGFIVGLAVCLLILLGMQISQFPELSFWLFLKTGFATGMLANWLKITAMFNLAPFFLFIKLNRIRTSQGVVFSTILIGLIIVYFLFK